MKTPSTPSPMLTLSGRPFTIEPGSLQFHSHDGVGPVWIPLRETADLQVIALELETKGAVSDETRKAFFAC